MLKELKIKNVKVDGHWYQVSYSPFAEVFGFNCATEKGVRRGQFCKRSAINVNKDMIDFVINFNNDDSMFFDEQFRKHFEGQEELLKLIEEREVKKQLIKNKEYEGLFPYLLNTKNGIKKYRSSDNSVIQSLKYYADKDYILGFDKNGVRIDLEDY